MHTTIPYEVIKEKMGKGEDCALSGRTVRGKRKRERKRKQKRPCVRVSRVRSRQNEGRDKETSELSLREKTARNKREIKEDIVADYLSAGKEEGGRYKIVASKRERSTH